MTTRHDTRYGAARVITGVGALFAVVEVLFILLQLFGANSANAFFRFVQSVAVPLALFFPGLFPIQNPTWAVIVTYGLAAVFWIVVTGLIARLIR